MRTRRLLMAQMAVSLPRPQLEIENEGKLSRPGEGERVRCKPQLAQRFCIETCVRLLSGTTPTLSRRYNAYYTPKVVRVKNRQPPRGGQRGGSDTGGFTAA